MTFLHRLLFLTFFPVLTILVSALCWLTAGIGENDADLRRRICEGLEGLGITLDEERNRSAAGELSEVHAPQSRVAVLVVRTNEELEIAEQTVACVRG